VPDVVRNGFDRVVQDLTVWNVFVTQAPKDMFKNLAWTMPLIWLCAQICHHPCQLLLGGQPDSMAHSLT